MRCAACRSGRSHREGRRRGHASHVPHIPLPLLCTGRPRGGPCSGMCARCKLSWRGPRCDLPCACVCMCVFVYVRAYYCCDWTYDDADTRAPALPHSCWRPLSCSSCSRRQHSHPSCAPGERRGSRRPSPAPLLRTSLSRLTTFRLCRPAAGAVSTGGSHPAGGSTRRDSPTFSARSRCIPGLFCRRSCIRIRSRAGTSMSASTCRQSTTPPS